MHSKSGCHIRVGCRNMAADSHLVMDTVSLMGSASKLLMREACMRR